MDYAEKRLVNFLSKAFEAHGDTYDYSESKFVTMKDSISIICHIHGRFTTSPDSHVNQRSGCPSCAGNTRRSTASFVCDAILKHGDVYDYSAADYMGAHTKVSIRCSTHGVFQQTPRSHLNGRGCPACSGRQRVSYETFLSRAAQIHGDRYTYVEASFSKMLAKMTIVCPEHGAFDQTPALHLSQAQGCPDCARRYQGKESRWLDECGVATENRQVAIRLDGFPKPQRVDGYDPDTNTVYEFYGNMWHGNPRLYKACEINPVSKISYGELYNRTLAREAAILAAGYTLVTIWEDEYRG